jgi:predicted O-methyltransferase YrrM
MDEVKEFADQIFNTSKKEIPGVDLNEKGQLGLLKEFEIYAKEIPFPIYETEEFRYYFNNDVFSYTDGIMLFCFLMHFKPKKVIEIGSGYSSALMLDTNNIFFNNSINLNFIEPYPDRLYHLIKESDKKHCTILEKKVQKIDTSFFMSLEKNDILFIDGSHVSKTGSDLNYLLFEVLPLLKAGVIIHFHDIFHKFEYPSNWVLEGRNWNECYLLRAFLTYNSKFKILMFNSFMHGFNKLGFENLSDCYKSFGGSLWIKKTED